MITAHPVRMGVKVWAETCSIDLKSLAGAQSECSPGILTVFGKDCSIVFKPS